METIVISGATSGIGKASLMAFAEKGYEIIAIGRSREKIEESRQELSRHDFPGKVNFVMADLSSGEQIREAASQIKELAPRGLYCLINNAGSFASSYRESTDGLEWQFAVNHMAPFLLTKLLLPEINKGGRIITVGSSSHFNARLRWKDPQMKKGYTSLGAYRQSKFFNVLMTNELNRRYADRGIRAFIADPGLVNTDIGLKGTKGLSRLVWILRRRKGQTVEEGASTTVFLASDPLVIKEPAAYYKYKKPLNPDRRTSDPALMERLWKLSESLIQ